MTRPAVLVMQPMLAPLCPFLESQYDVFRLWEAPPPEAATAIRAIITGGESELDKSFIEQLPNLELISVFTAGYDRIDVPWCRERGLKLSHSANVNHEDVADLAMGLIIASRRHIVQGHKAILDGTWSLDDRNITASIQNQRLGIVGLGAIGQAVARRAEAFNLEVSWWGPNPKDSQWPRTDSLHALAKDTDILVIATRADENNRGMIDREIMKAVGPHGLLVNVSRGSLVNEDHLIEMLGSGQLGAAALDVYAVEPTPPEQWRGVPNLLLSPHVGGATTHSVQGMLMLTLQNLAAHFAGEPLITPILD